MMLRFVQQKVLFRWLALAATILLLLVSGGRVRGKKFEAEIYVYNWNFYFEGCITPGAIVYVYNPYSQLESRDVVSENLTYVSKQTRYSSCLYKIIIDDVFSGFVT